MDPVINSLVQSPLVRSMSTVPSKASSFVHGVRDNVPPFSFQKVVVKPWNNPSKTIQDQTHKFRIPQYGTLNRAYLRIKMRNQVPDAPQKVDEATHYTPNLFVLNSSSVPADSDYDALKGDVRIPWIHPSQAADNAVKGAPLGGGGSHTVYMSGLTNPVDAQVFGIAQTTRFAAANALSAQNAFLPRASNAWNVINILDELRLTTNGKLVETVYGETIPAEVVKMPPGLRDYYIRGMVGYAAGTGSRGEFVEEDAMNYYTPWDPTACHRDSYGRLSNTKLLYASGAQSIIAKNQHAYFTVPVTLSSLKMLNKNYQTRFVEDLELEVKMKDIGRGFNEFVSSDGIKYHDVELVLIYHNWHDNIENTIRNSNYKRGVPASVYSSNWVRAATTAKAVSNTDPISIPITSRNLATEILVVGKSKSAGSICFPEPLRRRKSDYVMDLLGQNHFDIELSGSGKTIWSSRSQELLGPDSADYDLTERRLTGGDSAYGGIPRPGVFDTGLIVDNAQGAHFDNGTNDTTTGANLPTQTSVDYSFGDNMVIMRFGFQTTDEFYSGGIALQTISNPTIKITPKTKINVDGWVEREVEFEVYVKHANLVRIDSDTGAVSRTLDV